MFLEWNKMTLTYRIVTTTKDLPEQTVRKELKDALKVKQKSRNQTSMD